MLIVGLGNPGKEYEDTFHNCGFRVLDALAEKVGKKPSKIECSALTCVTQIGGQKVVLAKPLTYMNNSGEAVKGLLTKYGMKPQDMIVIYDDIDIPRYTVRVRLSGSAGTHNGMRSVVDKAGTEQFLGIHSRHRSLCRLNKTSCHYHANEHGHTSRFAAIHHYNHIPQWLAPKFFSNTN